MQFPKQRDYLRSHDLVMLSRSEASRSPTRQTLRGVYIECNECAQGDKKWAAFKIQIILETA